MTKTETITILSMLSSFYSGGKNDPKLQADAWHLILYKYDFVTAQKAVLNFAENDTRDYATFPAVGVIVKEIKCQQKIEERPYREITRAIQYGKNYDELSIEAKNIISEANYGEWLKVDPEEFANKAHIYTEMLKTQKPMLQ